MILGLTGPNCAGKGEAAKYLMEKKGFAYCSLSDIIRKECARLGLDCSRKNLIKVGNELREKYGPDILAKGAIKKMKNKKGNFVIDSIRNPAEVAELRKFPGFILLLVDAPIELRFRRAKARGRLENAKNLKEFQDIEEQEKSDGIAEQQLHNVFAMAGVKIMNNGTLEELHEKIENIIIKAGKKYSKYTKVKAMKIIILGPQGSGKGTQASLLAGKFGIAHISTGEILRKMTASTLVGKKVHGLMTSGRLIPDDMMADIISKRLKSSDCKKGWVLDGFPRNLKQAKMLYVKPDCVIYINISDKEAIKRISGRLQCEKCGAVYGPEAPPNKESNGITGICGKCSGKLYQREDDKPAAVSRRLEIFHKETEPLKEFYGKQGLLRIVNGNAPIDDVFENILKIF